jgi:hypothetical protein
METLLGLSLPGGVLALVLLAAWESRKRRKRPGTPLSSTYVNELTAMFYGTKRVQLDHQDSISLMREEYVQGAPPGLGVDLDRGVARLRPDDLTTD